jgi:histidine triad (HIT) family protein
MACPFCEIAAGRSSARILLQDEHVTAFEDIHPRAPTHVLIIPNRHIESLTELNTAMDIAAAAECLRAARELARKLGLGGGYRVVTNTGRDAGQSVFHLHFHLLAGRRMTWPPG